MSVKRIAILGGGPSGLFIFKRLVESGNLDIDIEIFEKKTQLGAGMPYSKDGADEEHITNVSGNELPELQPSLTDWLQTVSPETLHRFNIDADKFSDYKVIPRLLFGEYLSDLFKLFERKAKEAGIGITIHRGTVVNDMIDDPTQNLVEIITDKDEPAKFDYAIICTGHQWPIKYEGTIEGYFDSPYPPSKLAFEINHPVAIRGSSLTAVDAIRTLARNNGDFIKDNNGKLSFKLANNRNNFKIIMHTRSGMLPAVRFHLEDTHLGKDAVLSKEEIMRNMEENGGFLSLDFVFRHNFKIPIKEKDAEFYDKIKDMSLEEFVTFIMSLRESVDPFDLFKGEYIEAEKSIKRKESIYWKEMLAVLSFAMNYPAKYFSAEDTMRLQKTLQPLISIVIAFMPQTSVEELLALHSAGLLELMSVGDESHVEAAPTGGAYYHYINEHDEHQSIYYKTYVDAVGQPHLSYTDLPFKSLIDKKTVSPAKIKFRDRNAAIREKEKGNANVIIDERGYYLNVAGVAINDNFQVVDEYGASNKRIYMMAVPHMGGYNPDYSGLDFCEAASKLIVDNIFRN
ncbi:MAG: FAD/NAD(P)-binding protein [Ginsengibacter sp.]